MPKYAQPILSFFNRECRAYELKTSPHYRAQKQRFARRRRKEKIARQQAREQRHAEGAEESLVIEVDGDVQAA